MTLEVMKWTSLRVAVYNLLAHAKENTRVIMFRSDRNVKTKPNVVSPYRTTHSSRGTCFI